MKKELPSIFDMDIGKDPDDTCVAVMVALNPDKYNPLMILTNDEAESKGRARFLKDVMNSTGSDIPVAAGLPSKKGREDTLVERAGLVVSNAEGIISNGTEYLAQALSEHQQVNYFGLGALTNLATVLEQYPEFSKKINLIQMGMNFNGAYSRLNTQYNVKIDVESFRKVLEKIENGRFLMTHTSWGGYSSDRESREQAGVYVDDPLCDALRKSDNRGLNLFAEHLQVWKDDGKPCSIMHDPLTVLSFYESIVDFAEGNIVFAGNGIVDLTIESHLALRQMKTEKLAAYKEAQELVADGLVTGIQYSLDANYALVRAAIVNGLFGESKPELALEWAAYNSTHQ